jgi:hypothetical protein
VTIGQHYLEDVRLQLRKLKAQAERAMAQVEDEDVFRTLDPESNSIAIIAKHIAGNMRSRWTDFLTSDGEKSDRDRDREFEHETRDTRSDVLARWEDGWRVTLEAIGALTPDDLQKTVTIRGEPHTVLEAINRQVSHYAAHIGQIVLLSRHYAGASWQTLSIPRGQSRQFDVSKAGASYHLEGNEKPLGQTTPSPARPAS